MIKYVFVWLGVILLLTGCSTSNKQSQNLYNDKGATSLENEYPYKTVTIHIKSKNNIQSLYAISLSTAGITKKDVAIFPTAMTVVSNENGSAEVNMHAGITYHISVYRTDNHSTKDLFHSKLLNKKEQQDIEATQSLYEKEIILQKDQTKIEIDVD